MKRLALALTVGFSLACGGYVDSAKQAAQDRVEQEIAERAAEALTGADQIEVDGDRVTVKIDGQEFSAGTNEQLPADFPIATPADASIGSVSRFADGTNELVTVMLTGKGAGASDHYRQALTDGGWTITLEQNQSDGDTKSAMFAAEKNGEQLTIAVQSSPSDASAVVGWNRPKP